MLNFFFSFSNTKDRITNCPTIKQKLRDQSAVQGGIIKIGGTLGIYLTFRPRKHDLRQFKIILNGIYSPAMFKIWQKIVYLHIFCKEGPLRNTSLEYENVNVTFQLDMVAWKKTLRHYQFWLRYSALNFKIKNKYVASLAVELIHFI